MMLDGKLVCFLEEMNYLVGILTQIMIHVDLGLQRLCRQNPEAKVCFMKLRFRQVEKYYLQVVDIGVVVKRLLPNGTKKIEYGTE